MGTTIFYTAGLFIVLIASFIVMLHILDKIKEKEKKSRRQPRSRSVSIHKPKQDDSITDNQNAVVNKIFQDSNIFKK